MKTCLRICISAFQNAPAALLATLLAAVPLPATGQSADETLCRDSPLNSRCQATRVESNTTATAAPPQTLKAKLDTSAESNTTAATAPRRTLKVKLDTGAGSNEISEWVRLEVEGNQVRALHTTNAVSPVSKVTQFIPLPFLFVPNFYTWYDHSTTRLVFEPDECALSGSIESSCSLAGADSVLLPDGVDLHQGRFTIEYLDGKVTRTVAFRVPTEQ